MIWKVNAFLAGVALMVTASVAEARFPRPKFFLGQTLQQTRALCPTSLLAVFEQYHKDEYFVCDDQKASTVLIFDQEKLVGIIDLKYFATTPFLQPNQR